MEREFTTNHTNITNKAGISDKKFVFFVWLVVKTLGLRLLPPRRGRPAKAGLACTGTCGIF
jgi:hypothetical protein